MILSQLAHDINIDYNTVVRNVEVVGEGVRVGDQQGRTWEADKVYDHTTVVQHVHHYGMHHSPYLSGGGHSAPLCTEGGAYHVLPASRSQEVRSH